MVYQVFVNTDTLAVIRNDTLSRQIENKLPKIPGLPVHLKDHIEDEDFNEVWLIYGIDKKNKSTIPYFAFRDETKAREHLEYMKKGRKEPQGWIASYNEIKDLDANVSPEYDELKLKRVIV